MNKNKDQEGEHKIVVEVPVVLEKANVVFNMDHLAFAGDVPVVSTTCNFWPTDFGK